MKLGLIVPAALLLAACNGCAPQPDPSRASIPAPAPPAADAGSLHDQCVRACGILAAAGCAAGMRDGCPEACTADQNAGAASMLDVGCVLDAGPNAARLAACNVGGCGP